MKTRVADFLTRHPISKGKLAAWRDDIIALREAGASYRAVCAYLAESGVKADPTEVRRYLRRCSRAALTGQTRQQSPQQPLPPPKPPITELPSDGIPTFEWKRPRKPDKPSW